MAVSVTPVGSLRIVVATTVVVVLACVLVTWAALHDRSGADGRTPATAPAAAVAPGAGGAGARPEVEALAVLRAWDRDRASAWAAGDVEALRGLYASGAEAGREDVAMLRRWRARGLRVEGMAMQVLAVDVRARSSGHLVLVVQDRLVGATAVGRGRRTALPRDEPTTRRLELRRVSGRWVLVTAREVTSERGPP